ncbi:MAG: hypothetical protein JO231_21280 [Acidobacteria bacterium]|nr:hypothetical protein [Acidobacteriota bacterium]
MKWKSNLLSSSLPLEFEVSKQLVRAGAIVLNEYPYIRRDAGVEKEFSVDLHALLLAQHDSGAISPMCALHMLIECKYRNPNVTWLFLPKHPLNVQEPAYPASVVRTIDAFSPWFGHHAALAIDRKLAICVKGVEIDSNTNSVHGSEIKHGLRQLQFAMPKLIASQVRFYTNIPMLHLPPLLVTPILVTNAPLYVASRRLGTAMIERVTDPTMLGKRVPFLAVDAGGGPELELQAASAFHDLPSLVTTPNYKILDMQLEAAGVDPWFRPQAVADRAGRGSEWQHEFRRVIVCNTRAVPVCLKLIKESLITVRDKMSFEPRSNVLASGLTLV